MNWMLWTSLGAGGCALAAFLRGAFELSWDGLPWMFAAALCAVTALVFLVCGLAA